MPSDEGKAPLPPDYGNVNFEHISRLGAQHQR